MTTTSLSRLAVTQFIPLVNRALKQYQSVLALARSPLADSVLVHPLLVLDDVSPTADERGHALRLLLQWAVARLAPGPVAHPLGTERPYDDPTWRDPHWWRYNILRHRYLEPLHPDEFIDGGRFTETLIALTGITSADTFFDERNRAIREVAQRLHEQLTTGQANEELQQLALDELLRPLTAKPSAQALLAIAATFDDVFPRSLLLRMAATEQLPEPTTSLAALTAERYLLMGDGGVNLWLSPVLQRAVYAQQSATDLRRRHRAAATFYQREEETLKAAEHAIHAEDWEAAARWLLTAAPTLIDDLQTDELLALLTQFAPDGVSPECWCDLQLLAADLYRRQGQQEAALAACRQALRVATDTQQQGQLYWRMGKLYEKRNVLQALDYYERALTCFSPTAPTVIEVRKDRAWLYILRREWQAAEADLQNALSLISETAAGETTSAAHSNNQLHANILDALAHLYLEQGQAAVAIGYARESLHLRERAGDPLQVAKSFNNLGNFYSRMGEVTAAVAAHDEAIQLYRRLNNQELEAETVLNQGVVYHMAARQAEAIYHYQKSLALSQPLGLLLTEVTAHANLVEAHAELAQIEAAVRHWHFAQALCQQADFMVELQELTELRTRFDLPVNAEYPSSSPVTADVHSLPPRALLSPDAQAVLALAEAEATVTPKLVMARRHVSKATATRRLRELTKAGFLRKMGKGRGTVYVVAASDPASQPATPQPVTQHNDVNETSMTIRRLLAPCVAWMTEEYQVTGVLLLRAAQRDGDTWQLGVEFQPSPTLKAFFALEQRLSEACGIKVDLLPVDSLSLAQREQGIQLTFH